MQIPNHTYNLIVIESNSVVTTDRLVFCFSIPLFFSFRKIGMSLFFRQQLTLMGEFIQGQLCPDSHGSHIILAQYSLSVNMRGTVP